MAIRRKVSIDEMVKKGGTVASESKSDKEWTKTLLRVPTKWVEQIDKYRNLRMSRNAWILEAIKEKLKNDRSEHMG